MLSRCTNSSFRVSKIFLFILTSLSISSFSYGQSCGCIDPPDCAPCQGSLTSITFRYNGNPNPLNRYRVEDDDGLLASGFVTGDITVNSRDFGQPFDDDELEIKVGLGSEYNNEIDIETTCDKIRIGQEFDNGRITIISAISAISGPLCCDIEDFDETPPVFADCPTDMTISAAATCETNVSWTTPTASDNCTASPTITSTSASGDEFPLGTTEVIYTATDDNGNTSNCSFEITVIDDSAPVLTACPQDILIAAHGSCEAAVYWDEPVITDNCNENIELVLSHQSGDIFPLGNTLVTYRATDENDNTETCIFVITVFDDSAPVLTACPQDILFSAHESCEAAVYWDEPIITDNCSENIELVRSHQSGDTFPLGETQVMYKATDVAGNSTICSFNVTVSDDSLPVLAECPTDISISAATTCETNVSWRPPTAIDNCTDSPTITASHTPGDEFPIGTTEVIYTATDANGNEAKCSFMVTVINPFEPQVFDCPVDIKVEVNGFEMASVDWEEPELEWTCAIEYLQSTHEVGTRFPIGETAVEYSYSIEGQTVIACSFTVTVILHETELDIPKILTPNRDGSNDEWSLGSIEEFPDNQVIIVDRWGNEIYKVLSYNNRERIWRGENKNGELVPNGTYFYFIKAISGSSVIEKTGFLELMR